LSNGRRDEENLLSATDCRVSREIRQGILMLMTIFVYKPETCHLSLREENRYSEFENMMLRKYLNIK